jgi:hypothetical protein
MTRQAITTTYHGPTTYKGARVSATSESGIRVYIPYDYEGDTYQVHEKAVRALCAKLGWKGRFVAGGTKRGYVWVNAAECGIVI